MDVDESYHSQFYVKHLYGITQLRCQIKTRHNLINVQEKEDHGGKK